MGLAADFMSRSQLVARNCSQRIFHQPLLCSVLTSAVYRRHASQLAGEAGPTDAAASDLSSSKVSASDGSSPDHKDAVDILTRGEYSFSVRPNTAGISVHKLHEGRPIWHTIPSIWLRDNCRCSHCVNQDTMQRNFSVFDMPATLAPVKVTLETNGLGVTWNHEQHESIYPWDFIERYFEHGARPLPNPRRELWGSEMAENPPTVGFNEVMDSAAESGVAKLTDSLMRYGLVFVDGTPFDDAVHTKRLLERIGPIRETHYGGFYDFVPDMAKADTAYTNIALPAHTDTTYFTDPAGLQAFHMLSHTPPPDAPEGASAAGGESLLVDGFRAAEILRSEDPELFKILCTVNVPWHASGNQGVTITSDEMQPVIQIRKSTRNSSQPPLMIRWNNDDRGILPMKGVRREQVRRTFEWYRAAAKWNEILKRSSTEFWFQLKPGRTLIFDNYRVLHGRNAFTGMRRICGAYISRDDFMSRWRNTNLPREEVLAQVIG